MENSIDLFVADDDENVVSSISQQFVALGRESNLRMNVRPAYSGLEVINGVKNNPAVDAIILDYHFPQGMNGLEIIEEIADPFCNIFFVVLSGYPEKSLIEVVNRLSTQFGDRFQFLRKPVEEIEVRATYNAMRHFLAARPLPHPLSYLLKKMESGDKGMSKVWNTVDLVEGSLRYLAAILIADLARSGTLSRVPIPIKLDAKLTLGAWINLARALTKEYCIGADRSFIPALKTLLCPSITGSSVFAFLWKFHDDRNSVAHKFKVAEEWYDYWLEQEAEAIDNFKEQLHLFSRYQLIVSEKVTFSSSSKFRYQYDVRLLMGISEYFRLIQIQLSEELRDGLIYLYTAHGSLSLFPFLIYQLCKDCKKKRVLFLENITTDKFIYNAFCNHGFEAKGGISALKELFPLVNWEKAKPANDSNVQLAPEI